PPSGGLFTAGTTPVTCTATDAAGRSATCGFGVTVTARPLLSQTRFLAFGDSLTEGKLSLTPALLIDAPAHAYTTKLASALRDAYPDQPQITVINEGLAGERASDSLNRLNGALSTHRPEAVLLMHGVNDLNAIETGITQKTVDAVEELIKAARSRGLTVFVATLPPLSPPKASCPECVEPFNERLRGVAAAKGAVLVEVYAAWGNRPGLMGADGIHPTEAGYEVIAGAFFEAIRKALESPLP
ncbi:MAG: GDSL-type esterase/lipase family protein, partial [Vicinamibacterales bacterium]